MRYREREFKMVFVFMLSALIGAVATFAVLWPFGALIAVIGTPFGASLLALLAGFLAASRAPEAEKASSQHA